MENMFIKSLKIIEKKLNIYFANLFEESEFIPSKNTIYQFAYILEIMGFTNAS